MLNIYVIALGTLALLTGCAAGGSLGDSPTVGGQLQGNSMQPGYMSVRVGTGVTASGSIDAKGNFSVTLPGAAVLADALLPPAFSIGRTGCSGQVRFSPPTVRSAVADFRAGFADGIYGTSAFFPASLRSGSTSVLYVFFDQDASAQGTISCPTGAPGSPATTVSMNLRVSKGWNNLLVDDSGAGALRNVVEPGEPGGALPPELRWILAVSNDPLGTLCLADVDCISGRCSDDGSCACSFLHGSCTADSDCCKGTVCGRGACCVGQDQACTSILDCCGSLLCDPFTHRCR